MHFGYSLPVALIHPSFMDAVVAIGFDDGAGKRQYAATGFLYGRFREQVGDRKTYNVYLVTNRHVLEGARIVWVRFNPQGDEPAREYHLDLFDPAGERMWFFHEDPAVDLAVVSLNADVLRNDKLKFGIFQDDYHVATCEMAREIGISEGDGVFVLGFPIGIVGDHRNFVIARGGIIARIGDALCGRSKEILLDVTIFPGNSGGPVITKPEVVAITGTTPVSASYLIGVVQGYVPYQDIAISSQTNRPRIIFEENSGLTSVIPIDQHHTFG